MDFTREPIIESIITPKEGHKLVVRSSKSPSQEEYFVDAIEIVSFGSAIFYRSLEKPKAFLAPVSDYEVLEVREARMVLKNAGIDRSIKIGGGKDTYKPSRESEKEESVEEAVKVEEGRPAALVEGEGRAEVKGDKKRDRRRQFRKRRGREEGVKEDQAEAALPVLEDGQIAITPPSEATEATSGAVQPSNTLSSLLQPPPTLISETINRYRQNEMFKGAFYLAEEDQYKPHEKVHELLNEEDEEDTAPMLQDPIFDYEKEGSEGEKEKEENLGQRMEEESTSEVSAGKNANHDYVGSEEGTEIKFDEPSEMPIYADEEDKSMTSEEGSFLPKEMETSRRRKKTSEINFTEE